MSEKKIFYLTNPSLKRPAQRYQEGLTSLAQYDTPEKVRLLRLNKKPLKQMIVTGIARGIIPVVDIYYDQTGQIFTKEFKSEDLQKTPLRFLREFFVDLFLLNAVFGDLDHKLFIHNFQLFKKIFFSY